MFERWITALHTEDPGLEEPSATRDRFKERFPKNATRRMTQLGLLVGASLKPLNLTENDTLVYASSYAETRALEGYLDSFPAASPTLFQTSIHPSAVQQALIVHQQAVRQFFPLTGGALLAAQALQVALLAETPRTIICGGEERGTWLLEKNAASERTFAFALALSNSPEGALARIDLDVSGIGYSADSASLAPSGAAGALHVPHLNNDAAQLPLPAFFDLLHQRRNFDGWIAPARRLVLTWL